MSFLLASRSYWRPKRAVQARQMFCGWQTWGYSSIYLIRRYNQALPNQRWFCLKHNAIPTTA